MNFLKKMFYQNPSDIHTNTNKEATVNNNEIPYLPRHELMAKDCEALDFFRDTVVELKNMILEENKFFSSTGAITERIALMPVSAH